MLDDMKHSLKRGWAVVLMALAILLVVAGCGNDEGEEGNLEKNYEVSDFLGQVDYSSDVFSEAMTAYQQVIQDYPIQPFQFSSEVIETGNTVTEILNNFETDAEVQHMTIGESEEQIIYSFDSGKKLNSNTDETLKAYLGLNFLSGRLIAASVFTNQTDFDESAYLSKDQANSLLTEGSSLAQLGETEPTLTSFAQMNYDEGLHTSLGVLSQASSGGNILQLPIYNPDQKLVKLNNQNTRLLQAESLNSDLINGLISYYTQDILGLEMEETNEALPGGSFIPYEDFEKGIQEVHEKARGASETNPMTLDQVKEIMGDPRNQTGEAADFHSQKAEGEIEILTVVHNENEEVTSYSVQTQSREVDFPFNMEEIEKLGSMPADTRIEEIEEIYIPAPIKEFNLETKETMYMWYSDDQEAQVNVVQIMVDPEGTISGIAFDGNQDEEAEASQE